MVILWIAISLVFLGFFKYMNFFINSFRSVTGRDHVTLNIILPMGISFYVFSVISYLVDVYRGEIKAEKNLIHYAMYIAFFPKLTAGPIVRAKDFLPQIKAYRGLKLTDFETGIQIFVLGLFKKIVLADHLGVFVDDVFHAPSAFSTGTVILAAISYSLQIYFDFSGYSDMAIGVAKTFGFDFKQNFNLPYISQNVSEFWKRWHISLSSWFQDYVYIPLGGSRLGKLRTYVNLIIVMIVSGLWHGAGQTFIIWGLMHGIASCLYKAFGQYIKKAGKAFNIAITFVVTTLLWVIFRASNFENAVAVFKGIFIHQDGISQPYTWSFFAIGCLVIETIAAVVHSRNNSAIGTKNKFMINGFYPVLDLSKFWPLVIFFTFCGLTIIMGYYGDTAFIYGAF